MVRGSTHMVTGLGYGPNSAHGGVWSAYSTITHIPAGSPLGFLFPGNAIFSSTYETRNETALIMLDGAAV
eukprot:1732554-Pyramimonas_sp.AAC.1